ncbi:MAG: hypothetical protein H7210_05515 [Pyrinomonadaceae bacterium]|nr:hypothetical protein [Phycisphaerales bacterium]
MTHGKTYSMVGAAFLLMMAGSALGDNAASPRPGSTMVAAAALRQFQSQQPGAALMRNAEGRITNIYGSALTLGQTPLESASVLVDQSAALLGVDRADLQNMSILEDARPTQQLMYDPQTDTYKFTLVYFTQHKDGVPVFRADLRVLTRNEHGFPVVLAKSALRDLGGFAMPAGYQQKIISQKTMHDSARAAAPGMVSFSNSRLVVWAGMDKLAAEPALALEFEADNGMQATPQYKKELFLIDAMTGRLLYRENRILNADVTGNVSAITTDNHVAGVCDAESSRPMPYAKVTAGSAETYADALGNYTLTGVPAGPVTVTSGMEGRYFVVNDQAQSEETISQSGSAPGTQNFLHNAANSSDLTLSEVNSYVAANEVRDYLLQFNPSFPTISTQLDFPVNVNLNSTCNAFYDFASINFFRSGGGCNNTGFGTVVHHEYGHHVVFTGGSDQGEYGEGMGDVMGVLVTDTSELAIGFRNCSTPLRDANNTCDYSPGNCSTCGPEAHACGRLISGCVWSVRNNLLATDPGTYRQILSGIAINAVLLHQGSAIDPSVTLDYLILDDDDADVFNGTPHFTQINAGFSAHNLPGPELRRLDFVYPSGRPVNIDPAGGVAFRVEVVPFTGIPIDNTGSLLYSTGGAYTSIPMTRVSANTYDAVFPAFPCGSTVSYYISAQAVGNPTPALVTDPYLAPNSVFTIESYVSSSVAVSYDFETPQGWQAGIPGDNAVSGQWERGDPIGTQAQPEDDHTAGGINCFFTGQGTPNGGLGQADVDSGTTTLVSPTFSLAGEDVSRISYWRWYSNDTGGAPNADVFVVQISNNDGASWSTAETVGPSGSDTGGGWIYHQFIAQTILPGTAQMKLRFIASDLATGSLVEAALDDVEVRNFVCVGTACPADWNDDNVVNSQDFFEFLTSFFTGSADFNNSGLTDSQDFFDFVAAFFTPC